MGCETAEPGRGEAMEDRAQQEESKTDRSQPPLLRRVGLALPGIAVLALLLGVVLVAPRLIVNLDRGHDALNGTERFNRAVTSSAMAISTCGSAVCVRWNASPGTRKLTGRPSMRF